MQVNNILLQADSYKFSHAYQYPPGTQKVYSYIESRGGQFDQTVFFGLQAFLREYLSKPITYEQIDEAEAVIDQHMGPGMFYRRGWEYIVENYDGYLPLKVQAVPEGTVVPTRNALVAIENMDPNCFWLTSFVETALLRSVWYPTTVATNSWNIKQVLLKHAVQTSDSNSIGGVDFQLHDFGSRGVSSSESAQLGGMAHLVNFKGTDTVEGLLAARRYYDEPMAAFSVPASEHSTMTAWGAEGEKQAFENMLDQFGGDFPIISVVSDSYNIFNAVENLWGDQLREKVVDSGSMLVVRPDSGDPTEVVTQVALILDSKFGSTKNDKGYKVLNNVRILQGDGITSDVIDDILYNLRGYGFAAENMVFGLGGGLLQDVNRDTCKFAYKASAINVDGQWFDIYKDPVTDSGKTSKAGRQMLFENKRSGKMFTKRIEDIEARADTVQKLQTVFYLGHLINEQTFEQVRQRVNRLY